MIVTFAAAACGGGAEVAVSVTSGQGLASSAESAEPEGEEAALLLHVVRTEVHVSGGDEDEDEEADGEHEASGWIVVSSEARDVDLLSVVGTAEEIAAGEVPEGKVTQIRLVLSEEENASFVAGEMEMPVRVPSGEQSGLKLILAPPVTLAAEDVKTFAIELDGQLEIGVGEATLRPTAKVTVRGEASAE